jgi:hypothetical protein
MESDFHLIKTAKRDVSLKQASNLDAAAIGHAYFSEPRNMQLIWNRSGVELDHLNRNAVTRCSAVVAAIAYATDNSTLLDSCFKAQKPLKLYARYDLTGPISDTVLNWFLSKGSATAATYEMRVTCDFFHPKIICWKGVGAYIGSANLTRAAWGGNIEAGTYFTEDELAESGISDDLERLFDVIHEKSRPLTREIADQMIEMRSRFAEIEFEHERQFRDKRLVLPQPNMLSEDRSRGIEKRREVFQTEWMETLQYLRDIGENLQRPETRPVWLPENVPAGVLADQFLHAVYYEQVREGSSFPYREWHTRNHDRRNAAVADAVRWWADQPGAKNHEDRHIKEWAPFVRERLAREKLLSLTEDDFVEVCKRVHAMSEHATRVSHEVFGLEHAMPSMSRAERTAFFARWLYKQRTQDGYTPLEVIHFVLYDGPTNETHIRLFNACYTPEWKIPHMGVSALGEMVGWAMPEVFPPRNGRTSKALTALGYDVRIHSE